MYKLHIHTHIHIYECLPTYVQDVYALPRVASTLSYQAISPSPHDVKQRNYYSDFDMVLACPQELIHKFLILTVKY